MSLGTWRFFLAFLVAISHLWEGMIHGPAAYAVWGFFVLSGFLMTHVLNTKYGFTPSGLRDYGINRFLRIYPAYFLLLIAGLVTVRFAPLTGISPTVLNPQFLRPESFADWWLNITLIPIMGGGPLLVPVSGALAVEVGVYILVPLLAAHRSSAWLGLIFSFLVNAYWGLDANFGLRYSHFLSCFMAFSMGSLIFHYRTELSKFRMPRLSMLVWCLHCLVWIWYDKWPWTYGLYLGLLLSAWVVLSLYSNRGNSIDTTLGDLSYPLYLVHTTVGFWVYSLYKERSFEFFLISFALSMLVSWLIVTQVDRAITRFKRRA